jgi:hypothetical protein
MNAVAFDVLSPLVHFLQVPPDIGETITVEGARAAGGVDADGPDQGGDVVDQPLVWPALGRD